MLGIIEKKCQVSFLEFSSVQKLFKIFSRHSLGFKLGEIFQLNSHFLSNVAQYLVGIWNEIEFISTLHSVSWHCSQSSGSSHKLTDN